jgi:hypothetical protein
LREKEKEKRRERERERAREREREKERERERKKEKEGEREKEKKKESPPPPQLQLALLVWYVEYGALAAFLLCWIYWYNEWERNVDSWMREDNLQKHYDLLKTGQNQKAHGQAHKAFNSYRLHLAGSKYLLQMLLQLPILSQCSAPQPVSVEVSALMKGIADLQNHKQTPEYQSAVAQSKKRVDADRRLSQQIWQESKQLAKAKQLARKAKRCSWDDLTQEEQNLVIAHDDGRLERSMQNLMIQKTFLKPLPYKGAAACVANLQKGQRWGRG